MENKTIPFSQRRVDWIFVSFFLINLFFITYIVDLEQLDHSQTYRIFNNLFGRQLRWSS